MNKMVGDGELLVILGQVSFNVQTTLCAIYLSMNLMSQVAFVMFLGIVNRPANGGKKRMCRSKM